MANYELYHHGVKGQKWGVRRYQNKDGSLTPAGLKKYRKDYDDLKQTQKTVKLFNSVNKTGISAVDSYNTKYYAKQAQNKLGLLTKKIGNRGLSQIDDEIIREGKVVAEKARRESEIFNKKIQEYIDMGYDEDNRLFLRDPQRDYDYNYNRYLEDHLVER